MEISRLFLTATGLLPIVFLVSVIALRLAQGIDKPRAVMEGFLAWTALSYVSAETLAFFRTFSFFSFFMVWAIAISLILYRIRKTGEPASFSWERSYSLSFYIVIYIAAITLFIALTAEPNNWDSQTYHLPKIEHWIQNGSLAHYPTSIDRQNGLSPLAEIMLLHTRILSSSHVFYLLIQWISMICALAAVTRITRQLGGNETQSWIAAVFVATLPMGILQSTSTQNDYVVAALLVSFVSFGLQVLKEANPPFPLVLEAATAGALSGMAKPTGYLIGAGFALWFSIALARRIAFRLLAKWATAICIIFAIIIGPFVTRNVMTYGSIQSDISKITGNGSFGIKQTLDNLTLNIALNLATGILTIDSLTAAATSKITSVLGLDEHRTDTTHYEMKFSLPSGSLVRHKDLGPNPVHTILIAAALVLAAIRWRSTTESFPMIYCGAWLIGVVLFATILRWQPWGVRLQLPVFTIAAPFVALTWSKQWSHTKNTIALLVILLVSGAPALYFNLSRPLVPLFNTPSYLSQQTPARLFANRRDALDAYLKATDILVRSRASQIGLVLEEDDWEYPIWSLLRDRKLDYPIRIEHVAVRNGVRSWPLGPFIPEVLVWTRPNAPDNVTVDGRQFIRISHLGTISIYFAVDFKPPAGFVLPSTSIP